MYEDVLFLAYEEFFSKRVPYLTDKHCYSGYIMLRFIYHMESVEMLADKVTEIKITHVKFNYNIF